MFNADENEEVDVIESKQSNKKDTGEDRILTVCIISAFCIFILLIGTGYALHDIFSKRMEEKKQLIEADDRKQATSLYSDPDCGIVRCKGKQYNNYVTNIFLFHS